MGIAAERRGSGRDAELLSAALEPLVHRPRRHAHARPATAAAAAITAAALMAGYAVLAKRYVSAGTGGAPEVFLLCRQLVAAPLMAVVAVAQHGVRWPRAEHRGALQLLGWLNFVNAIGFVWGVRLTSAFLASVMQLSIPVLTLGYSEWRGNEPRSAHKLAGVLLTVCGCALVAIGDGGGSGGGVGAGGAAEGVGWELPVGVAVLLVQCSAFVGILTVQKPLVEAYPVAWVVAWAYAACTLWSCGLAVLDGSWGRVWAGMGSGEGVGSREGATIIMYSATFGCVAYFVLIGYASRHLSPTAVSVSVALEPVAVSAVGTVLLGVCPSGLEMCGYGAALSGSVVLARSKQQLGTHATALHALNSLCKPSAAATQSWRV